MIPGNPEWNRQVAAMTTQSRPLYTFEIPDEEIIITSFIPSEADVELDIPTLVYQPLWFIAAEKVAALKSVSLIPISGFTLPGDDGFAESVPPEGLVQRVNYGALITGASAYFSWNKVIYPPGMQDIRKAVSLDLVTVSSLVETGGYTPYGDIDYSVDGIPAELTSWISFIHDNTPGWVNRTDTLRLWPGNMDVGTTMPDITKIQVRMKQAGTTTGTSPDGNTLVVAPVLVVGFL